MCLFYARQRIPIVDVSIVSTWIRRIYTAPASPFNSSCSHRMRTRHELFPVMDIVSSLRPAVGIPAEGTKMKVTIHEDNAGALILADTLPPQFTPRSKHYAIKTVWFREQIVTRGIVLVKIDTVEQLGDMFTKGLGKVPFEYLRKKIMGW